MNIWYLSPYAGGPGIGAAWRAYYLSRELNRAGHTATVITAAFHHHLETPEPLPPDQTIDGVRYFALPARRYTGNGISRILNMFEFAHGVSALHRLVPERLVRPDAIVVSSPHPFAIVSAWRMSRRFGCRLAFEVRDLWPLSLTEILGASRWHPLVLLCGWLERFAYRRADVVVSLLAGVDRYIRDIGLAPRRFYWAPNGVLDGGGPSRELVSVDGRRAGDHIAAWRAEGRAVLIYAGSIGPPNAVEVLIDALSTVNHRIGAARLGVLIVGKGASVEAVLDQIRRLGLDNVIVSPPVPKGEALGLMASSDMAYAGGRSHDHLYSYGTSVNKLMDYMLIGLPVVFPHKVYRSPVAESGGGIALDEGTPEGVADAVIALMEAGEAGRREMGQLGQAYVRKHFDWRQIAAGYAEALGPKSDLTGLEVERTNRT